MATFAFSGCPPPGAAQALWSSDHHLPIPHQSHDLPLMCVPRVFALAEVMIIMTPLSKDPFRCLPKGLGAPRDNEGTQMEVPLDLWGASQFTEMLLSKSYHSRSLKAGSYFPRRRGDGTDSKASRVGFLLRAFPALVLHVGSGHQRQPFLLQKVQHSPVVGFGSPLPPDRRCCGSWKWLL